MHKERSGSLGSAPIRPFLQPVSNNPSDEQVNISDAETLEDARKLIRDLRVKTRQQAQQIMAWRRAYKMQELFISRLQREKCDQLKAISSKLLLFESRLIRKQKDIQSMLQARENLIFKQQRIIETLTSRLTDNGLEVPQNDITDIEYTFPDLESLNDSDSAVVMEDTDFEGAYHIPKFRGIASDGITVMRSISDAIDPNLKYTSRRSNGFLRRPEILETVYSVEEDGDNDQKDEKTDVRQRRESFAMRGKSNCNVDSHEETANDARKKTGEENCADKLAVDQRPNEHNTEHKPESDNERYKEDQTKPTNTNQVKTYNRVMSNHRSVTKPKDVKYKRINKAKSKSLEELRGRLKNWVDQGSKIPGIALEHSQSYA
ncbi:uncharacterized protein LOC126745107 isoform X2 [Anthonomus grandis grandis]|uniref:uncharacterized protein LOC126745107 isoform X2 n=1 Tax=Anthonomus grandis grandis TaxID=2921223 RepID=UPI0021650E3F|nr:uncharacterized protein LOC126745107 isoform X2 [Anthonomus grandis grandis]